MRVLVTAGPTREYIDRVRFITNASSGRMGFAVAEAAVQAGHVVTLLAGPAAIDPPGGCRVVRFVSADDLKAALHEHFAGCDALVMAAAVGDFRPQHRVEGKIPRGGGAITVRLAPTEDLLAGVAGGKRPGQVIVAFAVEDGPPPRAEAKARAELAAKGADLVVVNTPAAMGASHSEACILSPAGVLLPWARRTKADLAREIVALLESASTDRHPSVSSRDAGENAQEGQ
jgi:phosphopantothenoylcysteine decarboxylase/phosphopantothenate--cysteine ligase